MDESLVHAAVSGGAAQLLVAARERMRGHTLADHALALVREGRTSVDEAMRVADQLRVKGRVIRGRIGVTIAAVTKEVAESIGLGKPMGALVQGVESGGPAEKAGIEAGDIIVKVNGKAVDKSGDLPRIIGNTEPGSKAALQLFRRGATRDVQVTVGEFEADRPTRRAQAEPNNNSTPAPSKTALGLTVSELTEAQKRELKPSEKAELEAIQRVGMILASLWSKARTSMRRTGKRSDAA